MLTFTIWGFNLNLRFKPTSPELAKAAVFRGLYSRIARKLGVTPQAVRHVSLGISTSRRISKELDREIRRIKERNRELAA